MSTALETASPAEKTTGAALPNVVNAYLNFDGRCEEALEFYKQAVGANVTVLMRYSNGPANDGSGPAVPPDKIMHCSFEVGETTLLASDCHCTGKELFCGTSLALSASDDAAAERMFNALAQGGKIGQPLSQTFFASRFGVVTDQFGVTWMVLSGNRG